MNTHQAISTLRATIVGLAAFGVLAFTLGACSRGTGAGTWADGTQRSTTSPYSSQTQGDRNTLAAERLTREAADLIASKPERAEDLLRQALSADLFHGPAHNNLGVLYLKQEKFYEAASEFEWARKLMPGHPDPRLNLALTLEHAGRTDEALSTYAAALQVYPEYLPAVQAMARLQLRSGKADESTPRLLDDIAFRSESAQWRDWAARQRVLLPASPTH